MPGKKIRTTVGAIKRMIREAVDGHVGRLDALQAQLDAARSWQDVEAVKQGLREMIKGLAPELRPQWDRLFKAAERKYDSLAVADDVSDSCAYCGYKTPGQELPEECPKCGEFRVE